MHFLSNYFFDCQESGQQPYSTIPPILARESRRIFFSPIKIEFLRTMRKSKVPLKFILGALGVGTATVAGGTYAYHKMRSAPEQQKQETLPSSQLIPVSSLFDQNHITAQKIVLKCELECFPSEKRSANDPMSDNPPTTETENKTNQHPQKKEEAKPGRFQANSVKLVSDESSVPLETSELPSKINMLDTVSQNEDCQDLVLLGNESCQFPIMDLQQCEFATVTAKQNEIQHRLKPKNTSFLDDNRDSKKCDCVKPVKEDKVILVEPVNESKPSTGNWLSRMNIQEDSQTEGDKMDPEKCDCANRNRIQKKEESLSGVDTMKWLGEENRILKKCECASCVIQDKVEQATDWFSGLFKKDHSSSLGDKFKSADSKKCPTCETTSKGNQSQGQKEPANEALHNAINSIGGIAPFKEDSNKDLKVDDKKNTIRNEVEGTAAAYFNKTNWSDGIFPSKSMSFGNDYSRMRSIQSKVEERQNDPEEQVGQGSDKQYSGEKRCVCKETKKEKEGLKILSTGHVVFAIDI